MSEVSNILPSGGKLAAIRDALTGVHILAGDSMMPLLARLPATGMLC
jgi:hypothetical protein